MLLLLSTAGLVFSPLLFIAMDRANLRLGLMWFVALSLASAFWFYYLQQLWGLPLSMDWPAWGAEYIPTVLKEGWFLVDEISWPLGFSLTSLALATLLTGLAGTGGFDWRILGIVLSTLGLGMLGVLAGGLPVLGFAWMGFDLMELIVLLRWFRGRKKNRLALRSFSVRSAGTLLLLPALGLEGLGSFGEQEGVGVAVVLLAAAAFIRIVSTPYQRALMDVANDRRGLFNLMRMASAAGGLNLAMRLGQGGILPFWRIPVLAAILFFLLYAAIGWLTAENGLAGRQYWIMAIGGLAIAAGVQGQAGAAVAWALVLILGGSLLFNTQMPAGAVRWTFPIAVLLMAGLPFSPSWPGSLLFSGGIVLVDGILIITAAVMLAGYYRHAIISPPPADPSVSGVQGLSLLGALSIFAALLFAGWTPLFIGEAFQGGWWQGFAILGICGLIFFAARRGLVVDLNRLERVRAFLNPGRLLRHIRRAYRLSSLSVDLLSGALEGEAAVLWALLLLGLVVSAFSGAGF